MSNFAYLHLHTHFSSKGGPTAPAEWCRHASELGYTVLGFSDRSPLAGLPSIFKSAGETGLAALYGIEIDILLPIGGPRKTETIAQPALLFARNRDGVADLSKIASEAYAGWPGAERAMQWESLAGNPGNLVLVLLGGDEAGAPTPAMSGSHKKLPEWARAITSAFSGTAFVGLPHSGRAGDTMLAGQIASAAAALGLPVVATPTARYLRPEGAPAYEALKVARRRAGWPHDDTQTSVSTASVAPDRPGHDYLRSPEEAIALYAQWPEAVENVSRIIEMCTLNAQDWPLSVKPSGSTALKQLAEQKLLSALALDTLPNDLSERLSREIDRLGERAGAWIALASVVSTAKGDKSGGNSFPLGAPTATASGSLVAYALGISPNNPIGQTEPAWVAQDSNEPLPLPGIEISSSRRDSLLAALKSEYGPGRLAHSACPLPIMPTQAVQAAGSILGIAGSDLRNLALATIEHGWDALSSDTTQSGTIQRLQALALALKDAPLTFRPDPDTLLAAPRQAYGTVTLASLGPLLSAANSEWLPWTEHELSTLGYPAFTLASTQALSALDTALSLARRYPISGLQADDIDIFALPSLSDTANTILRKGELAGIPYLTAAATKAWAGDSDLHAVAQYVARSLNPKRPPAPDPKPAAWDEITAATGGALLYDDQLDALLVSLSIPADKIALVRYALHNSAATHSEEAMSILVHASGLDADAAQALWDALAAQTKALVNCDTAAAWGRTALWLIALKAAHPAAFLAGVLSSASHLSGISTIASEAKRLGVKIEPPDINLSEAHPTLQRDGETWAVLWGLNHLPGWHRSDATRFLAVRPTAGFTSLREVALAAVDANLSIAHIEALIHSGACDALGTLGAPVRDRDAMLSALPTMLEWAQATRRAAGQLDLFAPPIPDPPIEEDLKDGNPSGQLGGTIRNPQSAIRNSSSPRLRHLRRLWEEAHLGIAFTKADEMDALILTLEKSGDLRSRLITTAQVGAQHAGTSIYLVGILCSIRLVESSNPEEPGPLAAGRLEDTEGSIELVAFPPNYKRHVELWTESNLLTVTARVMAHDDGEIYLLSEHLSPFSSGSGEEAMTLTIKAPRQPRRGTQPETKTTTPTPMTYPAKPTPQPAMTAPGAPQSAAMSAQQHAPSYDGPATYSLIISLPPVADDHALIDSMIALKSLLNAHPGPDSVTIRVQYSPETGKWTSARLPNGVRFSHSLESAIRRLLGDDALAVIKLLAA